MLRIVLGLSALCAVALANGKDPNNELPPNPPPEPPSSGLTKKKLMEMRTNAKTNINSKKMTEKKIEDVLRVLKNKRNLQDKLGHLNEMKKAFGTIAESNSDPEKKSCGGDDLDSLFSILLQVFAANWMIEELLYFDYVFHYIEYGWGLRWSVYRAMNSFDYFVDTQNNRTAAYSP